MKLTGFLAISSLVNAQNETVKQMSPRIINGVEAKIHNHPWLVSMWAPGVDSAPNHCGGAILHEEWILTATHCLFSQSQRPSNLVDVDLFRTVFSGDSVMIGMTRQSDAIGRAAQNGIFEKEIVSAHCHPEFEVSANNVLLNDICLLRIKPIGEAEFGSFGYTKQDKVCLPESNVVPTSRCHAAGWGLTDNNDVEFITIFSATSAFRMINYGCGCKFCFFPCMCCCQIPIGGSSVQPEAQPEVIVVNQQQPNSSYDSYPPQYSQQYPPHMQSFRYSTSTDSSSDSSSSYGISGDGSYYINHNGQAVKMP